MHAITYPLDLGQLYFFWWNDIPQDVRNGLDLAWHGEWNFELGGNGAGLGYGDLYALKTNMPHAGLQERPAEGGHRGDVWRSIRRHNTPLWSCGGTGEACDERVLSEGAPSDSLVEVRHSCCDGNYPDGRPNDGFWSYLSPGSGIFFDVGRTVVAANHDSLWDQLGCTMDLLRDHGVDTGHPPWMLQFACARVQGYDSIQYTHQFEETLAHFEVVHLKDVSHQHDGCPDPRFAGLYTTGHWHGAGRACRCKPNQVELNCDDW